MGVAHLLAFITISRCLARGRIIGDIMQKDSRHCGHFIPSGANIVGGRFAEIGEVPWQLTTEIEVSEE